MVDVPRLRKEIEFIKNHPEQHNQGVWVASCGTYGCLAGNTAIHAGYKHYQNSQGYGTGIYPSSFFIVPVKDIEELGLSDVPVAMTDAKDTSKTVATIHAKELAQALLDLDLYEADKIFHENNTVQDIENYFEQFTGEKL